MDDCQGTGFAPPANIGYLTNRLLGILVTPERTLKGWNPKKDGLVQMTFSNSSEACDANAAQAAAGARAAALQRSAQQTMTTSPESWRCEWSEDILRTWEFDQRYWMIQQISIDCTYDMYIKIHKRLYIYAYYLFQNIMHVNRFARVLRLENRLHSVTCDFFRVFSVWNIFIHFEERNSSGIHHAFRETQKDGDIRGSCRQLDHDVKTTLFVSFLKAIHVLVVSGRTKKELGKMLPYLKLTIRTRKWMVRRWSGFLSGWFFLPGRCYCILISARKPGELIQFDFSIFFQMGGGGSTTNYSNKQQFTSQNLGRNVYNTLFNDGDTLQISTVFLPNININHFMTQPKILREVSPFGKLVAGRLVHIFCCCFSRRGFNDGIPFPEADFQVPC